MNMDKKDKCSLVWATPDAEKLVIKMARVSAPKNENNIETGPRLLRYLIKHAHWSPFEMGNMCVLINTERDISAQLCRHRYLQSSGRSSADIRLGRHAIVPTTGQPESSEFIR